MTTSLLCAFFFETFLLKHVARHGVILYCHIRSKSIQRDESGSLHINPSQLYISALVKGRRFNLHLYKHKFNGRKNPSKHVKNMQTPQKKVLLWSGQYQTLKLLVVRR